MRLNIRELIPFSNRKNYFRIGDIIKGIFIYKYMNISTAEACLNHNNVRFSYPSRWKDPFEKLFYTANYDNVMPNNKFETSLYAYCVTTNPECEAAWKMYRAEKKENEKEEDNPCVQFKIYIGQFRNFIANYVQGIGDAFEGKVNYSFNGKKILSLINPKNQDYSKLFKPFSFKNYLNLMLLKRPFYKYEEEIRFMIQLDHVLESEIIDIPMPWSQCLHSIQLPPGCSEINRKRIQKALDNNLNICKREYPQFYYRDIPLKKNTLYDTEDEIKNIIIR